MQFVLMMVIAANVYSGPSQTQVAVYDTKYECQQQADDLNEGSQNVAFVCLEKVK